jgi:hypothetical protein
VYTIDAVAGADRSVSLTLKTAAGDTITTYTTAATVAAKVWPGGDRAAKWEPTVDKTSIASGVVVVSWSDSDTLAVAPALYRLQLSITAGTSTAIVHPALVRLRPGVGTTAEPSTYCSFDDVERYAPWIDTVIADSASIESDLGEHRQRACSWLNDRIIRRAERDGWALANVTSWPSGQTSRDQFRSWLEAGYLMTTGRRGDVVREIAARMTVAMVCEPLLGTGPGDTPYQAIARRYAATADALALNYDAELDTDGDGAVNVVVRMGVRSCR